MVLVLDMLVAYFVPISINILRNWQRRQLCRQSRWVK
jgi:hypothetical protein